MTTGKVDIEGFSQEGRPEECSWCGKPIVMMCQKNTDFCCQRCDDATRYENEWQGEEWTKKERS